MKENITQDKINSTVNYTWIIKHFAFLMFLALLAVIYIANGHWADSTIRDINVTQKQVKDMEYEYKNLKSLEMYRSRESQVTQAAASLGLKPATVPPVKLELETSTTQN
ncbi:MAG: FtsL-like putative cell division protein [Parafilimonas sp.]